MFEGAELNIERLGQRKGVASLLNVLQWNARVNECILDVPEMEGGAE